MNSILIIHRDARVQSRTYDIITARHQFRGELYLKRSSNKSFSSTIQCLYGASLPERRRVQILPQDTYVESLLNFYIAPSLIRVLLTLPLNLQY